MSTKDLYAKYYGNELEIYIKMLDAARAGEDDEAYRLALQLKHMPFSKWVDHILTHYKPEEVEEKE